MRKNFLRLIVIIFSLLSFPHSPAFGASISGSVSYSGGQTGTILVAAFDSEISCSGPNYGDPLEMVELQFLGPYSIPNLSDGIYYLAAAILTEGLEGDIQPTDPWAIYDGCDDITPVVISGGVGATGKNMNLVDGTQQAPNPFYSSYIIFANSAHDFSGYWIEIIVEDLAHNATSVSVTGPGITGSANLGYNASEGHWDSSSTSKLAFTLSPMPTPLTYYVAITDDSGTTYNPVMINDYVEVFAANLVPGGGQHVTGTPVFSWTGVGGDYTYEIHLDKAGWHKYDLTATSVLYDGAPLTPDTTYFWHVNVADRYGNVSYAFNHFIYQPTQQEPPGVTTVVPSGISATSATLWGLISPHNDWTTYYFEYGPTDLYGFATSEVPGLTGDSTELVSGIISGLSPGTLYHYRAVAYNSGGISYGDDLTFTTRRTPLSAIMLLLE